MVVDVIVSLAVVVGFLFRLLAIAQPCQGTGQVVVTSIAHLDHPLDHPSVKHSIPTPLHPPESKEPEHLTRIDVRAKQNVHARCNWAVVARTPAGVWCGRCD